MIEKGKKINDRYEVIKSIGEGGMANVYLAYDSILDRKVAVKVLRGDLSNDEKFVRRFQREALSAANLSHPSIVELYDVGEDSGIYYIVMEYIEGKTLKQLIKKRGSITLSEAIDIMLQLTDGISCAHDSYIIHRDIKPQNIMIKEDGTIKITDFGIAMALNSTHLTQTNSVMGSVHYLPPEQASGKGSTIKSDIYSIGIMFYELLTGTLPFKGENAVEIALKQMKDPIPSVKKKNQAIPQSVENVILKSTAKNPKNRYNDTKELHNDLLTVLNEERLNEEKIVFQYPEYDMDDEKTAETVKVPKKRSDLVKVVAEEVIATQIVDEEKKSKKGIIIFITSLLIILLLVLSIFFIIPLMTKVSEVKVPDVTGLSIKDAEAKLKDYGFNIKNVTEKENSSLIEKGLITRTEPSKGLIRKKGVTITLYESLGEEVYEVEDLIGKNYIEIKTLLENIYKLKVVVKKKDVDSTKEYKEQEIIEQSVAIGKKLKASEEIILYIPNIVDSYIDMVQEKWKVADVEAFCKKYNIELKIEYKETNDVEEGTILSQSRTAKTPIVSNSTLKITVAKRVSDTTIPGTP